MGSHSSKEKQRIERIVGATDVVVAMLLLFASFNVLVTVTMGVLEHFDGEVGQAAFAFVKGFLLALVASQVICHSIWSVLGNGSRSWRLLVSSITAYLLYALLGITHVLIRQSYELTFREVLLGGVMLPAILIACQTPFWILRFGWRWQIVVTGNGSHPPKHKPLTILGLLVAITAVAVAAGAVRLGFALEALDLEFFVSLLVTLPLVTIVAGIPALFLVLWIRRYYIGWICSIGLVAAALQGFVSLMFVMNALSHGGTVNPRLMIYFLCNCAGFATGFGCFVSTPLLAARHLGVRLCRAK